MPVPVFGQSPELVGRLFEAVVVESFISGGHLVSLANVVFFKVEGKWFRIALDAGTVHWHQQEEEPLAWAVPENDWSYPHRNIGVELGLPGVQLSDLILEAQGSAIQVQFFFANGRRLVLYNNNDSSSYHVA